MIRVEDLVKRYKKAETNAVDGISFEVKAGEFFVLLGPNGAGETTTISILTTTLFLTTRSPEEAEEADRICIIDKGKVVSFGTPDDIKRDLVEEYVLVDASDRSALRDELARLGFATGDGAPFKVQLDGHSVHSILRSIETPLTVVKTHTPSLEDAYL